MEKTSIENSRKFVVMEVDWQYNDEYFYSGDGMPGYARATHSTLEAADKYARELTLESMRAEHNSFDEYGGEGIENGIEFKAWCTKYGITYVNGDFHGSDIQHLSDEAILELRDILEIDWYETVKVGG